MAKPNAKFGHTVCRDAVLLNAPPTSPATIDIAPFIGHWIDSDPAQRDFSHLAITTDPDQPGIYPTLRIQSAWGDFVTDDIYTGAIHDRTAAGFIARHERASERIYLQTNIKLGVAVVGIFIDRQADNEQRRWFTRQFLVATENNPTLPTTMPTRCASSVDTLETAHAQRLTGQWHNTNQQSQGIHTISIEPVGERVSIRIRSGTSIKTHNWGVTEAPLYACQEEDNVASYSTWVSYEFDCVCCTVQIRQNKGILAVTTFNRFIDSSGRMNYVTRELFHR